MAKNKTGSPPARQSAPAPVGKSGGKGKGGNPDQGSPPARRSAPAPIGKTPSKGAAGGSRSY